jgi:4-amino-4-deoxy-L-arabinose transferase-like glycosyltransferase
MPISRHLLIWCAGLAIHFSYATFTPDFKAPDEQAHFNYVKYLAEHREFPIQTSKMDDPKHDYEYYHPPLYYLLLTPVYFVADRAGLDQSQTLYLLRMCSILMWMLTSLGVWKLMQALQLTVTASGELCWGVTCLLPTLTFITSMVNNDSLLMMLSVWVVFFLTTRRATIFDSVRLGLILGLAMLTKVSAVCFVLGFAVIEIAKIWNAPHPIRTQKIIHFTLVILIFLLTWGPWAFRMQHVYGSFTAIDVANIPKRVSVFVLWMQTQYSFWSVAGRFNEIRGIFPYVGVLGSWALICRMVFNRRTSTRQLVVSLSRQFLKSHKEWCAVILINISSFGYFAWTFAQPQGRFLFPVLVPSMILFGHGFTKVFAEDSQHTSKALCNFLGLYSVSFAVYSIIQMRSLAI